MPRVEDPCDSKQRTRSVPRPVQRYFHYCTVRASAPCAVKERTRLSARSVHRPVLLPSFCFLLLCSLTNCALNQSSTVASPETQSLPRSLQTFHQLFLKNHKTLIKAHTTPFSTHSRSHSQISDPPLPISTDNHFRTQIFTSEASIEQGSGKIKKA